MGITWEINVYFNDIKETSIKVKSSYSLQEIRDNLGIDNSYYFKNKNNLLIICDQNYKVEDIYKNDENGGYRIDLTKDNYQKGDFLKNNRKYISLIEPVEIRPEPNSVVQDDTNRNILKNEKNKEDNKKLIEDRKIVNLYLNDFKNSAIAYEPNMSLDKIKELGGDSINKDTIFFLTEKEVIIEKIDNFLSKDCLIEKNGEMKINLVTKDYYKRKEIVRNCDELAAKDGPIDWFLQDEFFKKIKDYAGEQIAIGIINEIYDGIERNQRIDDREYVRRFKNLLIKNKNNDNNNHDNNNYDNNNYDNNTDYIFYGSNNNLNEEDEESGN